ncbi:MAG TPA: hypothetical protein VNT76_08490, partial [Candidatus Binatus sp.]|nr:hypothetical protein [Candidatus Binatus sp.]
SLNFNRADLVEIIHIIAQQLRLKLRETIPPDGIDDGCDKRRCGTGFGCGAPAVPSSVAAGGWTCACGGF